MIDIGDENDGVSSSRQSESSHVAAYTWYNGMDKQMSPLLGRNFSKFHLSEGLQPIILYASKKFCSADYTLQTFFHPKNQVEYIYAAFWP